MITSSIEVADTVAGDRAVCFGTAAVALGVAAAYTRNPGTLSVPIASSFALGICVVSVASAIFIAVGGIIQGMYERRARPGHSGA